MNVAQPVQDLVQMTECAAQGMILDLADLRRGYRQSVEGFQIIWNSLLPDVRGVQGVSLPSANNGKLVVDGLYGPQTSQAGNNFVEVALPTRASDIPTWYAQHQGMVAAMCAPAPPIDPVPQAPEGPPVVVVPDQLALEPPPQVIEPAPLPGMPPPPPPEVYVAPADMGPVIEAQMPQAQPPVEVLPPMPIVVAPDPQQIKEDLSQGPIQVDSPEPPGLIPEAPPVKIYAQPRKGDVPVLAIFAGLLVVGGVAGYWLYGRKKR
jgi:hypothetical protein